MRPVPKSSVSDAIVDQITDLISRNVLKPGDRLPSERELCRRFAVGRTSVREALRSLSVMGILTGRVGDGTFVADNESHLGRAYEWGFALDPKQVGDLIETRLMLESNTASWAAERATEENLEAIAATLRGMEQEDRTARGVPRVRRRLPPRGSPAPPTTPSSTTWCAHHPRLPAGVDQGEPWKPRHPGRGTGPAFPWPSITRFSMPSPARTPGPRARACAPMSCRAARTFSPICVEAPGPEPPCGFSGTTRRRSPDRSRFPGGRRR